MVRIKRIYDAPGPADGFRILVDRLWPRGIKKESARLDLWLKEIAPSDSLRKWLHADFARWGQFGKKYHDEITGSEPWLTLQGLASEKKSITLLYASREIEKNHALLLQQWLKSP